MVVVVMMVVSGTRAAVMNERPLPRGAQGPAVERLQTLEALVVEHAGAIGALLARVAGGGPGGAQAGGAEQQEPQQLPQPQQPPPQPQQQEPQEGEPQASSHSEGGRAGSIDLPQGGGQWQ